MEADNTINQTKLKFQSFLLTLNYDIATMARMVDISAKPVIMREATAEGSIILKKETIDAIRGKRIEKGDVVEVSRLAGIMAAKRTSEIIPLCHNIPIESVDVDISETDTGMKVTCRVVGEAKTGVEMEALTATSAALLSIWDMVKKYEKDADGQYPSTKITEIRVTRKVKMR